MTAQDAGAGKEPGATTSTAFLNGKFMPPDECRIPALDRGFIFGDAVYEVVPVYAGAPFECDAHIARLERSLRETGMPNPHSRDAWRALIAELIRHSGGGDMWAYVQVTRGVAPRAHLPPDGLAPTVFALSAPLERPPPEAQTRGVSAVVVEDLRWHRCDIKTTSLIANIMTCREAQARDADEAIMVRDGLLTEAASANVVVVHAGVPTTPPEGNALLPGITRRVVVDIAREHGVPLREEPVPAARLRDADEIWLTSSVRDIKPVTRLDGRPVGDGKPGPWWRRFSDWLERRR